jgi:hypothetical protein
VHVHLTTNTGGQLLILGSPALPRRVRVSNIMAVIGYKNPPAPKTDAPTRRRPRVNGTITPHLLSFPIRTLLG